MSLKTYSRALAGVIVSLGFIASTLPPYVSAAEPTPIPQQPVQIPVTIHTPEPLEEKVEVVVEVVPTPTPVVTRHIPQSYAQQSGNIGEMLRVATIAAFGAGEWEAMNTLMGKESGLNPYAVNKSSGACGIPQAYPCSKLINAIGSLDNFQGQVEWLINYVRYRYGTPSGALAHHRAKGWY